MKKTLTLTTGSTLLLLASCGGQSKSTFEVENTSPNIVYILADDMGYGDVRAYNPDCIPTLLSVRRLATES